MVWLPDGEKNSKICLFVLTWSTNVTDGRTDRHTDRHTDTAWLHRPRLCIASPGKNVGRAAPRVSLSRVSIAMLTRDIDAVHVCLSVCLSRCGISKQVNVPSYLLQQMVLNHSSFTSTKYLCEISTVGYINFAIFDPYLAICGKQYEIGP